MRHEMLPFLYWRDGKKGHAESAFRDTCRTSSGLLLVKISLTPPDPILVSMEFQPLRVAGRVWYIHT